MNWKLWSDFHIAAARLDMRGCNTAMTGERRSWSIAEIMAKSQRVSTVGQMGYSYFSLREVSTSKSRQRPLRSTSGFPSKEERSLWRWQHDPSQGLHAMIRKLIWWALVSTCPHWHLVQ